MAARKHFLVLLALLTAACTAEVASVPHPAASPANTRSSVSDEQPPVRVVAVVDGRTVELADGTKARISYLAEPSGCGGEAALEFARKTLQDKEVRVSSITPGEVSLVLEDGTDYALLAVRSGVARTTGVDGGPLTQAEGDAAQGKIGLWALECATVAPPPPPAPSTTTPPPPPCAVTYRVTSRWPGAFQAEVTVRNVSGVLINGWTLRWRFTDGQTVSQMWNASHVQDGAVVSATNADYAALITPNGSISIGFNGAATGANSAPTAFTLNSAPCRTD
ncbi:cellulose binding domain-containing protein [Lentzea sp. NPDC042327]|uniref:cellulose binding domain-containing protein n=1 Tax=Lentzea sp. NPDC042327 TaxID=3154801 RepID=UPI0033E47384